MLKRFGDASRPGFRHRYQLVGLPSVVLVQTFQRVRRLVDRDWGYEKNRGLSVVGLSAVNRIIAFFWRRPKQCPKTWFLTFVMRLVAVGCPSRCKRTHLLNNYLSRNLCSWWCIQLIELSDSHPTLERSKRRAKIEGDFQAQPVSFYSFSWIDISLAKIWSGKM